MNFVPQKARERHSLQLPLPFHHAAPATTAGRHIARRFCIPPSVADLVASLAGIGGHD